MMDPQVEVCLLSALVHKSNWLFRVIQNQTVDATIFNSIFGVWTNTEIQVMADQESQQGNPANLELWHHNV